MKNTFPELVQEFMEANGSVTPTEPTATLPPEVVALRQHLILEELAELSRGLNEKNLEKVADALADLLYVVYGTAVATGLGPIIGKLFLEVHRANMTKDLGPRWPGDRGARKGTGYTPPDLKRIIDNCRNSEK